MKRGRVRRVSENSFERDIAGRIKVNDKRIINYKSFEFAESNFIDTGDIHNYRQKADNKKGVVLFLHGLHDYSGRYGFLAQKFAK